MNAEDGREADVMIALYNYHTIQSYDKQPKCLPKRDQDKGSEVRSSGELKPLKYMGPSIFNERYIVK